ncbi:hypothetical protein AM571_PA00372 (plasmid) [Rhizobium etli 8C-3]|uniref:Uncharacterized protein n=1 Tax=Rhizobium etli 8C-3 TaxID=538025 RepID=A0A1L5PAN2_RHIET|nr:hypothetical protein AM571_PA00372 [Rhizobium etli 8C-3]
MIWQPSIEFRTSRSGDQEPQSATAYSRIPTSFSHTRKGLSASMAGRLEIIGITSECRKISIHSARTVAQTIGLRCYISSAKSAPDFAETNK